MMTLGPDSDFERQPASDFCRSPLVNFLPIALVLLAAGCESATDDAPPVPKAARPVMTMPLQMSSPAAGEMITGSVGAWKTEKIGFEVAGRVRRVIEPGRDIEGRILDSNQETIIVPGTVLATLQDERYKIGVESADSAVAVAMRRKEAIEVEIQESFPAQLESANAELQLAQADFDRVQRLVRQKATSESEADRSRAQLATARAAVSKIKAGLKARQADLSSSAAEVRQAENRLTEARMDARDTTLYSSFRGQVAQTHVVPGSHVNVGEPVVTVQMMDPIKVGFEVSAARSRQYRSGDTVRLFAAGAEGNETELIGYVHTTDPVADSRTRTFTVSLLVRNQKTQQAVPPEFETDNVARTEEIWPLNIESFVGGGQALMIEENAIRRDADGTFLWRISNRHMDNVSSQNSSPVLQVSRLRVTIGDVTLPFLNWNFVPIILPADTDVDPERDMFAGAITTSQGNSRAAADAWDGNLILLDKSGWLLRPGDVVRIRQGRERSPSGFYVPMKAIRRVQDRTYIFVAADNQTDETTARRIEVQLSGAGRSLSTDSTFQRIQPIGDATLSPDMQLIVEGAHFLTDGERILATQQSGTRQTTTSQEQTPQAKTQKPSTQSEMKTLLPEAPATGADQ